MAGNYAMYERVMTDLNIGWLISSQKGWVVAREGLVKKRLYLRTNK